MSTRRKHRPRKHARRTRKRTRRVRIHRRKQRGGEIPPEGPVNIMTNNGYQLVVDTSLSYPMFALISPEEQDDRYIYAFNVTNKNDEYFILSVDIGGKLWYVTAYFITDDDIEIGLLQASFGCLKCSLTETGVIRISDGIIVVKSIKDFHNLYNPRSHVQIIPPDKLPDDAITFHIAQNILM